MSTPDAFAFFTEDDYENFSLKPRFDFELFQAYKHDKSTGCAVSPVQKRKPSNTKQRNPASFRGPVMPSGQPIQTSQTLSGQIHKGVNAVRQEHLKPKRWTLKSPKPQCPYPKYSSLTHAQQQRYIELWQKHGLRQSNQSRYTTSPELIAEKQQLRKLQIMVHKEQQDFMKYAERVARHNPKDYEQLSPLAMQFIQKQWQSQEMRVKNLPQHYSLHQTVGIVSSNVFPTDPVLTFISPLLVLGEPRILEESTINRKLHQNVTTAFQIQSHIKPAAARNTNTKFKELIDDENAVKLASKYQANVVIATASLATLVDNHAPDFEKNWQIPFHVKSTQLKDSEISVKTVYISDPLTNPYFPHEASKTFHSAALRKHLTAESSLGNLDCECDDEVANECQEFPKVSNTYFDSLELDLSNLETFGSAACKSDNKTLKKPKVSLQPGHRGASAECDEKIQRLENASKEGHQSAVVTSLVRTENQTTVEKKTQEILDDKNINLSILPHSQVPNGNQPQEFNKTPSEIITLGGCQTYDKIGMPMTSPFSSDSDMNVQESPECKGEKSSHMSSNLETSCQRSMMLGRSSDSSIQPRQEVSNLNQSSFNMERNAFALESDCSEGELVIALSSDFESPQRKISQDNLSSSSTTTQKQNSVDNTPPEKMKLDPAEESQQSASEQTANRQRKRHASSELTGDAEPTPRRSCRLKKLHQSESVTKESPASPNQSEDSTCSSIRNRLDRKPNSKTESSLTSKKDAVIPDSPLSPPPSERGVDHGSLSPSSQARGATLVPESPMSPPFEDQRGKTLVLSCPSDPETSPHSPDPNHKEATETPNLDFKISNTSSVENLPLCKRYNLRSKTVMIECEEAVIAAVSKAGDNQNQNYTISSNTDHALNISSDLNTVKINIPDNFTAVQEEPTPIVKNENSTKVSERASVPITQHHGTKTPKKKLPVKTHTKQNKPTGEESTMDSILKLQEKLHSSKMENQSPPKPLITLPCVQGQSDICVESPSSYKNEMDGRVDYTLWRFGRLNILVRSSVDAVSATSGVTNLNKGQVTSILPKMEFQPHFGFEQISVSELTKLWINLLLQPGSKVIQGRINALTSDLILLEHFDMNSSIWEQPSFQPSQCMKMISQVLDKLTSLSEGHYLLCHSAGDMHVCILQSTTTTGKVRSPYDLHKAHVNNPMMQPCPPPLLPWLPLDTNLILPSQMAAGRIPATFPPKNNAKSVKGDVAIATKKKKKKKKKGGKK